MLFPILSSRYGSTLNLSGDSCRHGQRAWSPTRLPQLHPNNPRWMGRVVCNLLLVITTLVLLSACGGDDPIIILGTAAIDQPVANGKLTVSCVSGSIEAKTGEDGKYKLDVTASGLKFPCQMSVSGGTVVGLKSDWVLYTIITGSGVSNLTPLTHLQTAQVVGFDPVDSNKKISQSQLAAVTDKTIADASEKIKSQVALLTGGRPADELDFIKTPFDAIAGNGMQKILAEVLNGLAWSGKSLSVASAEILAGKLNIKEISGTCKPGVITGFTGNIDDVPVQIKYDPNKISGRTSQWSSGTGTSPGGAYNGSSGAIPGINSAGGNAESAGSSIADTSGIGGDAGNATGGTLGQFLRAIVRVERADGSLLGEATTDDTRGLVSVIACRYNGPLHITVKANAQDTTQYFEEATGGYVKFPAGQEIHSVVARADLHIGVTILTHAAWSYVNTKYGKDGWKTASNVIEANAVIRDEFNRHLSKGMQISDITRLPVSISENTPANSIGATPSGLYGIVVSGLSRAAGLFKSGDVAASIKLANQFGADLCDGNIDYSCNGVKVVENSKDATYIFPQFDEFLTAGIGASASFCGDTEASKTPLKIVQIKMDEGFGYYATTYRTNTPIWMLRSDGRLFYWPARDMPAQPFRHDLRFKQLFSQGGPIGATIDGKVWLSTGQKKFGAAEPWYPDYYKPYYMTYDGLVEDSALKGVTTGLTTSYFRAQINGPSSIFRTANGEVLYSGWGSGGSSLMNASLSDVVAISANSTNRPGGDLEVKIYMAVNGVGQVFGWGLGANYDGLIRIANIGGSNYLDPRYVGDVEAPTVIRGLVGIKDVRVAEGLWADEAEKKMTPYALTRTGEVLTWGGFDSSGQALPVKTVDEINRVGKVRAIECSRLYVCSALMENGELYAWGRLPKSSTYVSSLLYGWDSWSALGVLPDVSVRPTKINIPEGRRVVYMGGYTASVYAMLDNGDIALPTIDGSLYIIKTEVLPDVVNGNKCTDS